MSNKPAGAAAQTETKRFDGGAYILRKSEAAHRRHRTFDAAEAEAQRLCGQSGDTFVITQEVASVKAPDPDEAAGCADDQKFGGMTVEEARKAAEGLRRG